MRFWVIGIAAFLFASSGRAADSVQDQIVETHEISTKIEETLDHIDSQIDDITEELGSILCALIKRNGGTHEDCKA